MPASWFGPVFSDVPASYPIYAADRLNDGFTQTSQLAVGFFLSHEGLLLAGSS